MGPSKTRLSPFCTASDGNRVALRIHTRSEATCLTICLCLSQHSTAPFACTTHCLRRLASFVFGRPSARRALARQNSLEKRLLRSSCLAFLHRRPRPHSMSRLPRRTGRPSTRFTPPLYARVRAATDRQGSGNTTIRGITPRSLSIQTVIIWKLSCTKHRADVGEMNVGPLPQLVDEPVFV